MSKKKLRRHLRRVAERKKESYGDSIRRFYGRELSDMDINLMYSLYKRTPLSEPKRDLDLERMMCYDDRKNHGHS